MLIVTFFTTAYKMRDFINFFLGMLLLFNFTLNCCEYWIFHLCKQKIQTCFTKYNVHFKTYGYEVNIIICAF